MPNVPAQDTGATSASFKTAVKGGTTTVTPLDLSGRMGEEFDTVLAEDTVEVARGGSEKENTDNAEETGLLQLRDPTTGSAVECYKEVHSEAIPANLYNRTVEMVPLATLDMQLVTKDYVEMETQRLRSEITSIFTF